MKVVDWLTWEKIPIDEIPVHDPRKEFIAFSLYAIFFVGVVLGFPG